MQQPGFEASNLTLDTWLTMSTSCVRERSTNSTDFFFFVLVKFKIYIISNSQIARTLQRTSKYPLPKFSSYLYDTCIHSYIVHRITLLFFFFIY